MAQVAFPPVAPEYEDGDVGLLEELEEADDDKPHSRGCADWFLNLHVVQRWLIVFAVVGGLAGLLVGLLLRFDAGPGDGGRTYTRPIVVNTWFSVANAEAYQLLQRGYSALDAVELGCTACEDAQCDGTVGWGSSEDSTGAVSLDAIIMDAETHDVGAVTYLTAVRHAIAAARKVMHYSTHTLLAGAGADDFAIMMGLPRQELRSNASTADYEDWVARSCQQNNWVNVVGGNTSCPPYAPIPTPTYTPVPAAVAAVGAGAPAAPARPPRPAVTQYNHDTVSMCAIDAAGRLAGGGSSNGLRHKIAGRSSDIGLTGAGLYADREGGCAAATGDGDITQRFLPAFAAVEFMRVGLSPGDACERAVRRIMAYHASFQIGLVCLDRYGNVGAASFGWTFTYAVAAGPNATTTIVSVPPLTP